MGVAATLPELSEWTLLHILTGGNECLAGTNDLPHKC